MVSSTQTGPKATLADVAALAGVSPATASRVLNGTARVSGQVRAEVEAAVTRLSYVRHRARSSSCDRAACIAAVVCEDSARLFTDSFFARILAGANQGLPSQQVQLALLMVQKANGYSSIENYLSRGHADGVLLIGAHGREPLASTARALGVPMVLAGRPLFASDLPYVDVDNRDGAREAVARLLQAGRRTVVSVAGPPDMAAGADRLAGYRDAIKDAGAGGFVGYGDFTRISGERAMAELLERRPDLDAVFVASDLMALGALRALRRAGRKVPDDVAVIGFDDAPFAQHTDPRLTTVRQPVEEMGFAMTRQLLHRIDGAEEAPQDVVLDTELVVRESG